MLDIQLGRRNLSPIQRIAVAEKYRPIYEKQAKEQQSRAGKEYGNGGSKLTAYLPQASTITNKDRNSTTDKKLSDIAGVSEKTYRMGAKVLNSGKKDVKPIIEPIIITPDKVIVSGHQRVRACKEFGIKTVMCDVHTYHNEDEILQDLLETNIRQRGDIGGSDKQIGKRIKELERIYGSKVGRPKNSEKISELSAQEKNAKKMDMDVRTLRNYKMLTDMIPELEKLVDSRIAKAEWAAYLFLILWCAYDF